MPHQSPRPHLTPLVPTCHVPSTAQGPPARQSVRPSVGGHSTARPDPCVVGWRCMAGQVCEEAGPPAERKSNTQARLSRAFCHNPRGGWTSHSDHPTIIVQCQNSTGVVHSSSPRLRAGIRDTCVGQHVQVVSPLLVGAPRWLGWPPALSGCCPCLLSGARPAGPPAWPPAGGAGQGRGGPPLCVQLCCATPLTPL